MTGLSTSLAGSKSHSSASTRSSTSSRSFSPVEEKSFTPLSSAGLCEALIMTPRSKSFVFVSQASPGVVSRPALTLSTPSSLRPAAMARSRTGPELRPSCAMRARRAPPVLLTLARARDLPSDETFWGVNQPSLKRPRTPSVPKILPLLCKILLLSSCASV